MTDDSRSNNAASECQGEHRSPGCGGRREFLVRVVAGAGGLVLALSLAGCAGNSNEEQAQSGPPAGSRGGPDGGRRGGGPGAPRGGEAQAVQPDQVKGDEIMLKVGDNSPLNKVGGSQTIETSVGKIVVARTGEANFVAVSAVCTHKKGPINYDGAQKQFFCPLHGSRFDLDGKVLQPPARAPLQSYVSRSDAKHSEITVSLKPSGQA